MIITVKNKKQAKKASSKKNIQNKNGLDAAIYVGGASAQLAQVIYSHKDYDEYSQLDIFLTCAALFYIEIITSGFLNHYLRMKLIHSLVWNARPVNL